MVSEYNDAGVAILQGPSMASKLGDMPKTEQVRIPIDVVENARMVASAFKQSVPEYVTEIVQAALARDLPKAAKILAERAEQANKGHGKEKGGGK